MPALFSFLLLLLPQYAWATADTPTMTDALLRTTWALLVVAGLILAVYGLIRRRLRLGKPGATAIRIVEMRPLAPKSTLALVEVRGRHLLLGVSTGGINLLADVTGEETPPVADFPTVLAEQL